jgi:hypothetical protein
MKKILLLGFLFVSCAYAAEVVVSEPQVSFMTSNLDVILKSIFSLLGILLSFVTLYLSYKRYNNETLNTALEALQAGVAHSEDTFVDWAKRAKADGQLTKDERNEALRIAREKAFEVAKGPALALLKAKGTEILNAWIKRIVEKKSAK